jgi:hypothetical protein
MTRTVPQGSSATLRQKLTRLFAKNLDHRSTNAACVLQVAKPLDFCTSHINSKCNQELLKECATMTLCSDFRIRSV